MEEEGRFVKKRKKGEVSIHTHTHLDKVHVTLDNDV